MCCLGFVGTKALEYWGLSLTTASDTAILIAAEALATVLLSVAFLTSASAGSSPPGWSSADSGFTWSWKAGSGLRRGSPVTRRWATCWWSAL